MAYEKEIAEVNNDRGKGMKPTKWGILFIGLVGMVIATYVFLLPVFASR